MSMGEVGPDAHCTSFVAHYEDSYSLQAKGTPSQASFIQLAGYESDFPPETGSRISTFLTPSLHTPERALYFLFDQGFVDGYSRV